MTTDHSARELTEAAQDTARRRVAHFCDVFKHIPDDGKVGIGLDGPGFLMGDLRALLAESVPAGEPVADRWHPWAWFLEARRNCIDWLVQEHGYSDERVAKELSMDVMQVTLIKMSNLERAAAEARPRRWEGEVMWWNKLDWSPTWRKPSPRWGYRP